MSSESGRPVCFRAVVSYSWLTVVEILVRMPQYVACGVAWHGDGLTSAGRPGTNSCPHVYPERVEHREDRSAGMPIGVHLRLAGVAGQPVRRTRLRAVNRRVELPDTTSFDATAGGAFLWVSPC